MSGFIKAEEINTYNISKNSHERFFNDEESSFLLKNLYPKNIFNGNVLCMEGFANLNNTLIIDISIGSYYDMLTHDILRTLNNNHKLINRFINFHTYKNITNTLSISVMCIDRYNYKLYVLRSNNVSTNPGVIDTSASGVVNTGFLKSSNYNLSDLAINTAISKLNEEVGISPDFVVGGEFLGIYYGSNIDQPTLLVNLYVDNLMGCNIQINNEVERTIIDNGTSGFTDNMINPQKYHVNLLNW